jgi:uncharacterized membrane protein YsdA (DUF1294 family)
MLKILWIYCILINIIGIYIMYSDKEKAKHGQYRIPEATLWRIAIIGGAIGTTIGMHWFRHKTKHMAFKFGFPVLAIIDIGLLFLILSR